MTIFVLHVLTMRRIFANDASNRYVIHVICTEDIIVAYSIHKIDHEIFQMYDYTHNMTSLIYTKITFSLPDDLLISRYTRRCVPIKYDKKYLLSVNDLPPVKDAYLFPYNERYISPLAMKMGYRAPNLPDYIWLGEEQYFMDRYHKPGTRIQIYSTITSVNIRTEYYLERTAHFIKKWKRIIVTHHLSELALYRCHVICELSTELFRKPESPPPHPITQFVI